MTEQSAAQQGRKTAAQWVLSGTVTARSVARQGRGDLTALFARCERMERNGAEEGARELLDQLWLLSREAEQAMAALRGLGKLPAVRQEGRSARVERLGEALAEECADLTPETLTAYLEGVQSVSPLGERELAALLPCLTLGLLHRVRQNAEGPAPQNAGDAFRACFAALRLLSGRDFSPTLEALSPAHACFSEDETYRQMDRQGRWRYRERLAELARKSGQSEGELARQYVDQARQSGTSLGALLYPSRPRSGRWYLWVLGLLTLAGTVALGWRHWALALLGLLPVSELVKQIVDFIALHWVRPRPVFRLELKEGVPPEGKTLCVLSALLTDDDSAAEFAARLERTYLANRRAGDEVNYGLLADLPDAPFPPGEGERARLAAAREAIDTLNQRCGERFFLFTREPSYAARDGCYRGHERKRGALMELISLLRGLPTPMQVTAGERARLTGTVFLITLDSDTRLSVDGVRRLVGAMLHPLNRAVVDAKQRIVTQGYGLLQPRVLTDPDAANATLFSALFCGPSGRDPYTAGAADLYHDLFDRGSYCGKGILDVEAAGRCLTGRFPEGRILSHDLLEGIILHAGFCAQVEVSDGFPATIERYYRRQHRWVRGDWQAARWIASRVPNQAGRSIPNPIAPIERWKLFDNLRRSLLSLAETICLAAAALLPAPLHWAAWLALAAIGAALLLAGVELTLRRFRGSRQRVFSQVWDGFTGSAARFAVQLLLLPCAAWCDLSAIGTALWRLLVTRRGLLDWTVSAQTSGDHRFWLPGTILGALLILFAPDPLGKVLGVLWLLAPLLLHGLSQPRRERKRFSEREQSFLIRQAELIWRYFDTWLRPEDHFLPPDNVQELPSVGPARRTSPTNIGLALLSCLAALDLHLARREEVLDKITRQLDTLEQLEKWNGHLYNWYDTAAAAPLYPRYVSTVDSGNLCGALIALKQGLLSLGQSALAARADALAREMHFSPLFDGERELFYIGYDVESQQPTESWYDLLASEARQTSYLAVARGEAPPRHWERLSRVMTCRQHRFGLASWSGTMFEYFMPHLLLPVERGSLLFESLAFCAWAQRKWGEDLHLPWGVSESAYNRLDQHQNYQYKAHGVPPLGLQRRLERERVVAPYASFLALELLPHSAVENLRKLCAMGAQGRYGPYEAVDFTPDRTGGSPVIIHSWMAHHLGMSLLAVDNALNDGIMRRRFLAEHAMEAYRELLQERIPLGLTPPKRLRVNIPRTRPNPARTFERSGTGFDPAAPACHLLAAGELSQITFADGGGALQWNHLLLCDSPEVRWRTAEREFRLSPADTGGEELRWRFSDGCAEWHLVRADVELRQRFTLDESGALREWSVRSADSGELELRLIPILERPDAYEAHRAFARLGLDIRELAGGAVISRRPREGREDPSLVFLWEGDVRVAYTQDGTVRLMLRTGPVESTLRVAVAAGAETSAYHAAQGLLLGARTGHTDLFRTLCARYRLDAAQQLSIDELTSCLLRPRSHTGTPRGQSALWPFGISGDDPIWAVFAANDPPDTESLCIRQWAVLRGCAFPADLVFLLPEGQSIERTAALQSLLSELQLTAMLGAHAGIHLVPATPDTVDAITGMAALCGLPAAPASHFSLSPLPPIPLRSGGAPQWRWEELEFILETHGSLPPRRWSHILTNPNFGWTADECGSGHLWSGNAHENKLTPWQNDPYAHKGPERLILVQDGAETALFAAADGIETRVRYGPGFAAWEKHWDNLSVSLTAFVPPQQRARVFLLRVQGTAPNATLRWHVQLQMGARERMREWISVRAENGRVTAQNPANTDFAGQQLLFYANVPLTVRDQPFPYDLTMELPVQEELVLVTGMDAALPLRYAQARDLLENTRAYWVKQAAFLRVRTPDAALDHYLSFWGRYQTIACRLMARTALYQCGGAYGFRDQLQDACGLLPNGKDLFREQFLRCCRHQYQEGDVQHWWHPLPQGERGVRTRISDDLLWLPYAACRWVAVTGDRSLLEEPVDWLVSPPLRGGERERYEQPSRTSGQDSALEHCVRAIECALARGTGAHGLALIGTGDWNDGMDRLGREGRGESVWLTWFLALVLEDFSALCAGERRDRYRALSAQFARAAADAWDGGWYRRAYDDAGQPVGSRDCGECRIDSIAQSFAVFAPNPEPDRARQAVQAAIRQLYRRDSQTVALLTPPFLGERIVGYISAYPPGVRENGGQYTHAAVWLAMAAFRLGDAEQGWELLRALLPERLDGERYQAEPYVLAGDVSTAPGQEGRAGWTWYTGAASWYCRAVEEELLGLRVRGNRLFLQPRLPRDWHGYDADWSLDALTLHIHVSEGSEEQLTVNGVPTPQGIPLEKFTGDVEIEAVFVRGGAQA